MLDSVKRDMSYYFPKMLPSSEGYFPIPNETVSNILSFSNMIGLKNASLVCRTFALLAHSILSEYKHVSHKINAVFRNFQNGIDLNFINFPKSLGTGYYELGPLLRNGALLVFEKGSEDDPPLCYGRGNFDSPLSAEWAEKNNGWLPYIGKNIKIGDREITSPGEKLYFFSVDDYEQTDVKVINQKTGAFICKIEPSQGLKTEVVGAHSFDEGYVITITRSGMISKWTIQDKVLPIGEPVRVFDPLNNDNGFRVEETWLSGNALYLKIYKSGLWSLVQYDIRSEKRMSELDLAEFNHITINDKTLFVVNNPSTIDEQCCLNAYRIDQEQFNFSKLWTFLSTKGTRYHESQDLAANDRWVVANIENDGNILILEAESGKNYWEVPTKMWGRDVYLSDDMIFFRDTYDDSFEQSERLFLFAHLPTKQLVRTCINDVVWEKFKPSFKSRRIFYEKRVHWKINIVEEKIYCLFRGYQLNGLLEFKPRHQR